MRKLLAFVLCLAALFSLTACGKEDPTDALRESYPEYFDLPTAKGLEVYVWQMAQGSYSFGVLPGTNREKTFEELMNLKGVSAEDMRQILSSYDLDREDIIVIPYQNPLSSYIAPYWIRTEGEDPGAKQSDYVEGLYRMLFPEKENQ